MVVEHTFSRVKKFHIRADEFRGCLRLYDEVTDMFVVWSTLG